MFSVERLQRAGRFPVQPLRAESWGQNSGDREGRVAEWLSDDVPSDFTPLGHCVCFPIRNETTIHSSHLRALQHFFRLRVFCFPRLWSAD